MYGAAILTDGLQGRQEKAAQRSGMALRRSPAWSVTALWKSACVGKIIIRKAQGMSLDCEGVVGMLKRKITGEVPGYITTYQTFNEGGIDLDPHYFYAYLQPELSEYDAWFNVKDDLLVLGVSVKDMDKIGHYYESFIAYMEEKHHLRISRQTKEEKWLMPHIRPGCRVDYGVGRILFAGEVAGVLNPMGEGVSAGMESGYAPPMQSWNISITRKQSGRHTGKARKI